MGMLDNTGIFMPKVGDKKTFTIKGVERVEVPDSEDNFKKKGGVDAGFYMLIDTDIGKIKLNTWKLYFAMKDANVDIGDTIEVDHKGVGEYVITKKEKKEEKDLGWEE